MTTAERLVRLFTERHLTCATAESCTGGGVGAAITDVPGASAVYLGGVVAYAESAKRDLLGVPASLLAAHGAVSRECAESMAVGARTRFGADFAVSVTGLAGPGGDGTHPAGHVWFALATPSGVQSHLCRFPGDRPSVRSAATSRALSLLLSAAAS
jgi:PncC family amidohydrolase